MPRAKTDDAKTFAGLDAEVKAMQEKSATKRKAAKAARVREFVEKAKFVRFCDYADDTRTVYEMLESLILHPPQYNLIIEDSDPKQESDMLDPVLQAEGLE